MRIESTSAAYTGSINAPRTGTSAAQAYTNGASRQVGDAVSLSGDASGVRRAHAAAAAAAPELRAEKVAELRAQVQAGAYQVDSYALAEKLAGVL